MLTDKYHDPLIPAIRHGRLNTDQCINRRKPQQESRTPSDRHLFWAASHVAEARLCLERALRSGCAQQDRRQLQSIADGLHKLTFLLEKCSQRETR